jgi:hypothetical protein
MSHWCPAKIKKNKKNKNFFLNGTGVLMRTC